VGRVAGAEEASVINSSARCCHDLGATPEMFHYASKMELWPHNVGLMSGGPIICHRWPSSAADPCCVVGKAYQLPYVGSCNRRSNPGRRFLIIRLGRHDTLSTNTIAKEPLTFTVIKPPSTREVRTLRGSPWKLQISL
jgi:hypothetical protein